MKLLICVPTYNEAENISPLIRAVFSQCPSGVDMLVIDDSSPDGTGDIVEGLVEEYKARLHIIRRPGKQGGASAFLQGFKWGIGCGYDAILAMDADFSHDPKYIPVMLDKINECDVVVGSRLIKGGYIENRTFVRNIISTGASIYCRLLLGVPVRDWTGGYNLWSKNALLKIGVEKVVTRGYSFQIEMKYKAHLSGCKIVEIPITFPDRKHGTSKMPLSYFIKALIDVWKIKFMHKTNTPKQFIRFSITGGLGTMTNLILFFIFADKINLPEIPVSAGCFLIAGTQNYIVNHKWSFSLNTRESALFIKKWVLFLTASLAGLLINIAVMKLVIINFSPPYKFMAQACGIAAGMFVNFTLSKIFVFRRKNNVQ